MSEQRVSKVEEFDPAPSVKSRSVLSSTTRSFLIGGLICFLFGVADVIFLEIANRMLWPKWLTGFIFTFFVLQTFVIGSFVGHRVKESSDLQKSHLAAAWFFFFGWTLSITNVFLISVLINSDWTNTARVSLVYSFFSAQIGLSVCWLILGKLNWKQRMPIGCAVVFLACYPLWAGIESCTLSSWTIKQSWRIILFANLFSVIVTCGILSLFRFGFAQKTSNEQIKERNSKTIFNSPSVYLDDRRGGTLCRWTIYSMEIDLESIPARSGLSTVSADVLINDIDVRFRHLGFAWYDPTSLAEDSHRDPPSVWHRLCLFCS